MDFITLEQTVGCIAGRIKFPDVYAKKYTDLAHIYKMSEAAANLHQQLHNFPEQRPRWVARHIVTERLVFDDTVAVEGMEILEGMAGWFRRLVGDDNGYFLSPDLKRRKSTFQPPMDQRPHGRGYRKPFKSRGNEIGFDRFELVRFLNDPRVGIDHAVYGGVVIERGERPAPQRQEGLQVIDRLHEKAATGEVLHEKRTAPRLCLPDKSDVWAKAIAATYEIMVRETGGTPSSSEVWLRMNHKPPTNYPIKVTKDHGLAAVAMPGEKPLTREGFTKRWRRYTSAK